MEEDIEDSIQKAIESIQLGDKAAAGKLLSTVIRGDPNNASAWYLLSQVVERQDQIVYCLERVLRLESDHALAKEALQQVKSSGIQPEQVSIAINQGEPQDLLEPKAPPDFAPETRAPQAPIQGHTEVSAVPIPWKSQPKKIDLDFRLWPRKYWLVFALLMVSGLICGSILVWVGYRSNTVLPGESSSASKTIPADQGGYLRLGDQVRLDIPAGALEQDTSVIISKAIPEGWASLPDFARFWEINAGEGKLQSPVTLTFSYAGLENEDSLAPDAVFVARWEGEFWEILEGTIDPEKKVIVVESDHLSLFAVVQFPDLDFIISKITSFLGTCGQNEDKSSGKTIFNPEWTELANEIMIANESEVQVKVFNEDSLGNFRAGILNEIFADEKWYRYLSKNLPHAGTDTDFLLQFILSHEISHINLVNQGEDLLLRDLNEQINDIKDLESWFRLERYQLAILWEIINAIQDNDCPKFFTGIKAWFILRTLSSVPGLCQLYHLVESYGDEGGVLWSSAYNKDEIRTALIVINFYKKIDQSGSCFHPSSHERAINVAEVVNLGNVGGILGRVDCEGGLQPRCADVSIKVDGQPNTITDSEGRFLAAPLNSAMTQTLELSKNGYFPVTLSITVPVQDIREITRIIELKSNQEHFPTREPQSTNTPLTRSLSDSIAFVGSDYNIWILHRDSGEKIQVTTDGSVDSWYGSPQWSPSGDRLAFCHHMTPPGVTDNSYQFYIYTARPDGSDIKLITEYGTCQYDWSPDGVNITTSLQSRDPHFLDGTLQGFSSGIININVETLEHTLVAPPVNAHPSFYPIWSPDGKWLLFHEVTSVESGTLTSYDLASQQSYQAFFGHASQAGNGSWSPDGSQLVFDENIFVPRPGTGLYISGPNGQNVRKIYSDPGYGAFYPIWSPDGGHIAFYLSNDLTLPNRLMMMNADGSGVFQVSGDFKGTFVWSMRGDALLLNNNGEIMVYDLNTNSFTTVAQGAPYGNIDWFKTGSYQNSSEPSARIAEILQQVQLGIERGSPDFLDALTADQVYIAGCCSEFSLSTQRWESKQQALDTIKQDWTVDPPSRCLGYRYQQVAGPPLYTNDPVHRLLVFLDNAKSFFFTDGLSPELTLTEYHFMPVDVIQLPADTKPCPAVQSTPVP